MNTRENGSLYEKKAALYLEEKGYSVLSYNYRCKFGEIDLVVKDDNYIVFVEVKHRKDEKMGNPLETVTYRKIKRISMTASYYIMMHKIPDSTPIRFDIIGFLGEEITHIENAFEYSGP